MMTLVLLLALAVFAASSLVKAFLSVRILPGANLLLVLALSQAGWFFADSVEEGVLIIGGSFGLATLIHAVHKFFHAGGDYFRMNALRSLPRR